MEESFETFEDELWPSRGDTPPQKPVRQTRRPEMYATRKIREEMAPVSQQSRPEPKTLPREPSLPRTAPLQKALSIQNLAQIETPWENVTLNRCLFVAITILVLTSGFQRLNENLRGRGAVEEEEEVGLTMRRTGNLRHRGQPLEPETSLWDVMFWWLPDFDDEEDDEDDEDDEGRVKRAKSKKGAKERGSSSLRNKKQPDKKLMKQKDGKLRDRRGKKAKKEERIKDEEDEDEEPEEAVDNEEEVEETVPKKKSEDKKEKRKTQKG